METANETVKEKAHRFLEKTSHQKQLVDGLVVLFGSMIPGVTNSAWRELLMSLDYSWLHNKVADRMAARYSKEEFDQLLEWADHPVFVKFTGETAAIMKESQGDSIEWLNMIKDDLCSNIYTCFLKHGVDRDLINTILKNLDQA